MIFSVSGCPDRSNLHRQHCTAILRIGQTSCTFAIASLLALLVPLEGRAQPKDSKVLGQHSGPVYWLAFAASGKELYSASPTKKDGKPAGKVWDIASGKEKRTFASGSEIKFSTDAKLMAIIDDVNHSAEILDTTSGQVRFKLAEWPAEYTRLAFSPDNQALAVAAKSTDSRTVAISLRDLATGKKLRSIGEWQKADIYGLAFSPDGKRIVSSGTDGSVQVWDANTGAELATLISAKDRTGGAVDDATFSPDGRLVAAACQDGVRVWEFASRKLVAKLPIDSYGWPKCVAFSPDGRYLATASDCRGMADFLRAWYVVVWNTEGW